MRFLIILRLTCCTTPLPLRFIREVKRGQRPGRVIERRSILRGDLSFMRLEKSTAPLGLSFMTAHPRKISASCPRCSAVSARQRFFPGRAAPTRKKRGRIRMFFTRPLVQPTTSNAAYPSKRIFPMGHVRSTEYIPNERPPLEIFSKSPRSISFLPSFFLAKVAPFCRD